MGLSGSFNGDLSNSPKPSGTNSELTFAQTQAELEKHIETQRGNLTAIMSEWDDLVDWVNYFPRKYLPRAELLAKLQQLRPF